MEYYRVKESRRRYMGERYFRYNQETGDCITVVFSIGDQFRRGRANTIGVYVINKLTFFSNYQSCGYVERIEESEFVHNFELIVGVLK